MGYIKLGMRIPWFYYVIAVVMLVFLIWQTKKWSVSLLISYIFLVLAVTIMNRHSTIMWRYDIVPFKVVLMANSRRITDLLQQAIANILLFFPIGFLTPALTKKNPIFLGFLFSLFLEVIQLVTRKGVFEIDDIIFNTIGAAAGLLMYKKVIWRDM